MLSDPSAAAGLPPIDEELLEELSVTTYFTRDEIRRLYTWFLQLGATSSTGTITAEQLFRMPELAFNQMRSRLEEVWAEELAGRIDLRTMVRLLSPLARGCPRDVKIRFAFKIHDADGDGSIGEEDLRRLVRTLLGVDDVDGADDKPDVEAGNSSAHGSGTSARVAPAPTEGADERTPAEETALLVEKVVSTLLDELDSDTDRNLSFEEWVKVVANMDVVSKLTLYP